MVHRLAQGKGFRRWGYEYGAGSWQARVGEEFRDISPGQQGEPKESVAHRGEGRRTPYISISKLLEEVRGRKGQDEPGLGDEKGLKAAGGSGPRKE